MILKKKTRGTYRTLGPGPRPYTPQAPIGLSLSYLVNPNCAPCGDLGLEGKLPPHVRLASRIPGKKSTYGKRIPTHCVLGKKSRHG